MIDSHSHTILSHDGHYDMLDYVKRVKELQMEYFAVTEHYDRDYKHCPIEFFCKQLNIKKYVEKFNETKKIVNNDFYLAMGLECGYHKKAVKEYVKVTKELDLDVVINSVHSLFGGDAYTKITIKNKSIDVLFNRYLDLIYESLCVPYQFDVVGHVGYITRYTNFEDNRLYQPRFYEKIDKILNKIIELDKTLEINSHIVNELCTPEIDLIKRYYELGGRNITFSSDAHYVDKIGDKYNEIANLAKEIGFKYWTVYKKHKPIKILI